MKKIKGIMTGLLICVFLIMGSMAVWADQTGAVSGQTRVFDQAGLFSETEKIQLEEEIAQCRKNTKMDVVVVSAYAARRKNMQMIIMITADLASERKPAVYCFCTIWTDRASQEENVIFLLQGQ
jgi:hypothetical protein